MHVEDRAIVLSIRKYQEKSAIVKGLTENNGVVAGFVKNITSKSSANLYLPGNVIEINWKARLGAHLGSITAEPVRSFSNLILDKTKFYAVNSILEQVALFFIEHEPHVAVYEQVYKFLEEISVNEVSAYSYFHLELFLLQEAGFALDLETCNATGSKENLIYVSPKSGCAVSKEAGTPFANQMLRLPKFLINNKIKVDPYQILEAYDLLSYFIKRHILPQHNISEIKSRHFIRDALIESVVSK